MDWKNAMLYDYTDNSAYNSFEGFDQNVEIIFDSTKKIVTKRCTNLAEMDRYSIAFENEYSLMNSLHAKDPVTYEKYFPKYYSVCTTPTPSISMQFINGITLNNWLSLRAGNTSPHQHLTNSQILHLFDQLTEAEKLLLNECCIQLDLNTRNIIVLNDNFDIRLVDFTDCFYINQPDCNPKLTDAFRTDPEISSCRSLQLREAGQLLFSNIFYSDYNEFSFSPLKELIKEYNKYAPLFNSMRRRNNHDKILIEAQNYEQQNKWLIYWNDWFQQLKNLLNN